MESKIYDVSNADKISDVLKHFKTDKLELFNQRFGKISSLVDVTELSSEFLSFATHVKHESCMINLQNENYDSKNDVNASTIKIRSRFDGIQYAGHVETLKTPSPTSSFVYKSENGKTIGVVTIFVDDEPNNVVIIPVENHAFQAISRKPGKLSFYFENFTDDYIKFDIYHKNELMDVVDPGPSVCINQWNELRSGRKMKIEADQSNENRIILLGNSTETMTIGVNTPKKNDGFKVWIDCVPLLGKEDYGQISVENTSYFSKFTTLDASPSSPSYFSYFSKFTTFDGSYDYTDGPTMEGGEDYMDDDEPATRPLLQAVQPVTRVVADSFRPVARVVADSFQPPAKKRAVADSFQPTAATRGRRLHGEKIYINTYDTGERYSYDKRAPLLELDFGIATSLESLNIHHDDLITTCLELHETFIEKTKTNDVSIVKEQKLVYDETNCPVCLEEYNDNRTVLLPCGHSVCYGCYQRIIPKKCPVCRGIPNCAISFSDFMNIRSMLL